MESIDFRGTLSGTGLKPGRNDRPGETWGQGAPNTLLFIYCPTVLFFLLTMEFWEEIR